MKLARIRTTEGIRPALIDAEGAARDLSAHINDITAAGVSHDALAKLRAVDAASLPKITGGYAPILDDIRRILCIGLNFSDHAEEAGMAIPEYPILFSKLCDATGANDPIIIPKGSVKTDWEVELGVVIGQTARHVSVAQALDHVAGYCIVNDVSERTFQIERGGQWSKGKSCDSFAPIGPWLVTADEIADVGSLAMELDVNGVAMQRGNTDTMIFDVATIVSHLSEYLTLKPGDVIATGTPPGVGMGHKPPQYLKAGDTVRLSIAGLGEQTQQVVAFDDAS